MTEDKDKERSHFEKVFTETVAASLKEPCRIISANTRFCVQGKGGPEEKRGPSEQR